MTAQLSYLARHLCCSLKLENILLTAQAQNAEEVRHGQNIMCTMLLQKKIITIPAVKPNEILEL